LFVLKWTFGNVFVENVKWKVVPLIFMAYKTAFSKVLIEKFACSFSPQVEILSNWQVTVM